MSRTAEEIGSKFTVGLGDNFYSDGVTDIDDPRFSATFEVSTSCCVVLRLIVTYVLDYGMHSML